MTSLGSVVEMISAESRLALRKTTHVKMPLTSARTTLRMDAKLSQLKKPVEACVAAVIIPYPSSVGQSAL